MNSIKELLSTIMSIPSLEMATRLRAQMLLNKLSGHRSGFNLGSIFGGAR